MPNSSSSDAGEERGEPDADVQRIAAVVAGVIDAVVGLLREHTDAPHGHGLWYQGGGGRTVVDRLLRLRAELDAVRYLRPRSAREHETRKSG